MARINYAFFRSPDESDVRGELVEQLRHNVGDHVAWRTGITGPCRDDAEPAACAASQPMHGPFGFGAAVNLWRSMPRVSAAGGGHGDRARGRFIESRGVDRGTSVRLTMQSRGRGTQAGPGAQLGDPHFDGFAVLAFARGLGFGKRLHLVGRARRPQTGFRELVRRGNAAQVRLGRVRFGFTQEKIARGDVGVNLDSDAIRGGWRRRLASRLPGNTCWLIERESQLHTPFRSSSCARLANFPRPIFLGCRK